MLILPLAHFAAVLPAAVSAARCEALRSWLTGLGFSPTGHGYPAGYRDNDRLVLDDPSLANELWQLPALQRAIAALGPFAAHGAHWRPVSANPRFRACRYAGGQSFTRHRDGAYSPSAGHRTFLTAQLYLDEGFDGGATRFYAQRDDPSPQASVIPRQGTLIVFDHRAWHDGEAVSRGQKHVLRSDIVFARTGEETVRPASGRLDLPGAPYVFALVARRDGTLAAGTRDGLVSVLRREGGTWRLVRAIEVGPSSVTSLAEDSRGRLYAGCREGFVKRLDETGITSVWQAASAITALAVGEADGLVIGTAGGTLIHLLPSGEHREHTLPGWIWGLAVRGTEVHVASEAGLFQVCSATGTRVRVDARPVRAVARDVAGRVFTGDAEGFVHGSAGLSVRAQRGAVDALVADDRGGFVSAGEDGAVVRGRLDGDTGRWTLGRTAAHDDFARAIALLADGTIASGGYDGTIRLSTLGDPSG